MLYHSTDLIMLLRYVTLSIIVAHVTAQSGFVPSHPILPVLPNAPTSPPSLSPHLIGGSTAPQGQFAWQVAIRMQKIGCPDCTFFCGGTLVSDQYVLTAAHCVINTTLFNVRLGTFDNSEALIEQNEIPGSNAIMHYGYNASTLNNDIALIKLKEKISVSGTNGQVKIIRISKLVVVPGVQLNVSGWGFTNCSEGGISTELRFVSIPSISNDQCRKTYNNVYIIGSTLCTNGTGSKGVCSGDSGGPLVIGNGIQAQLVGVVSFTSSKGCCAGDPSGFVRVVNYLPWMSAVTGIIF